MKKTLSISAHFTAKDLEKALQIHYKNFKKKIRFLTLFLCVGTLSLAFFHMKVIGFSGSVLLLLACGVYFGMWFLWWPRTVARSLFKNHKKMDQKQKIQISAKGLSTESNRGTAQIPWSSIEKAYISPDTTLLYQSKCSFITLPRRFFKSKEYDQLKEIVRAQVSEIHTNEV